jgi:hypothetical protein
MSLPQVDQILYARYLVLPGIFPADKNHRCCVGQCGISPDLCSQIICTTVTGSLESRDATSTSQAPASSAGIDIDPLSVIAISCRVSADEVDEFVGAGSEMI